MVANVAGWAATIDGDAIFTQIRNDLTGDYNGQIDNLVLAARDERPDAMGLILSQDVEFFTDFCAVLMIKPGTHPRTFRVLHIASLIGSFAALFFKSEYDLPRPSQICPALLPPIPVPGHSSWPSGHATQAHLMKNCMIRVFAAPTLSAHDRGVLTTDLTVLADEIARNREIAGLHYPKDSEGGARLAELLDTQILTPGTVPRFDRAIERAKSEWP
jgi:hypothetical protein